MTARLRVLLVLGLILLWVVFVPPKPVRCMAPDGPPAPLASTTGTDVNVWHSGWFTVTQGGWVELTHGLGGDVGHYAVDLWFWDVAAMEGAGLGVHTFAYGGMEDDYAWQGAYWTNLTDQVITVNRKLGDEIADYIWARVRVVDATDYDSGWFDIAPGGNNAAILSHLLGGDAEDYTVSLWFKSAESLPGVHSRYFGGLEWDGDYLGAHWQNLTASSIKVVRWAQDEDADQVRVRIVKTPPDPAYDSGWQDIAPDETLALQHDVGGRIGGYAINLQYRDVTQAVNNIGINSLWAGGGEDDGHYYGGHWQNLTNSTIEVYRQPDGQREAQVRVRIWMEASSTIYLPLIIR